ncbi:MAG: fumarylacetoacetate hydrolase family protein [Chloroflexota bacterium]
MGYNILRFKQTKKDNSEAEWGVQKGETITPFAADVTELKHLLTAENLQAAQAIAAQGADDGQISLSDVEILSPITRPTRLLAMGLNFADHREETGNTQESGETLFFRKDDSSITSATGDIHWPGGSKLLDYEVEMGIVLKNAITQPTTVTAATIGDYVAGVVLANDVSPRDLQSGGPFGQWYKGKSYRTLCPLGPYLHIFEEGEATKLHDMQLKLWVNDELRQDAHTQSMITKPEEALSLASEFVDLEPGDVLLSGTPGGVALRIPDKDAQADAQFTPSFVSTEEGMELFIQYALQSGKFLKPGDLIRCSLKSADGSIDCGEQVNRVVRERQI